MGTATKTRQPTPQERIKQLEESQKRQQADLNRQRKFSYASNALTIFRLALESKADDWLMAAEDVGSAYKLAVNKHHSVLDDEKARHELSVDILFTVLAAITVGGISWLSSWIQARKGSALTAARERLAEAEKRLENVKNMSPRMPQYQYRSQSLMIAEDRVKRLKQMPRPHGMIVEALEDGIQSGADDLLTTFGPRLLAEDPVALNKDPMVFQNEQTHAIRRVKKMALDAFRQIRTNWQNEPPEFWDTYDAKQQDKYHAEWLREAQTLAGEKDLWTTDLKVMADEMERGIWKQYIVAGHDIALNDRPIYNRLVELGVVHQTWGGGNATNPFHVPAMLVNWATFYQVKPYHKAAASVVPRYPSVEIVRPGIASSPASQRDTTRRPL